MLTAMRSLARHFDQRGIAMPLALVTLLIVSGLVVGFSVLSATEPTIASNQLRTAQARALAEAGVERAIWALTNATDPNGIPIPLVRPAPAPFDGSRIMPVSAGGSRLGGVRTTVTTGGPGCRTSAERCITSVGWVPEDYTPGQAHRQIAVTVANPRLLFKDPPAALSVRGDLQIGANTVIDAKADTSCGKRVGTVTTGTTSIDGTADIQGATDGNNAANEVTDAHQGPLAADAHDLVTNLAASSFDAFVWSDAEVNLLRTYAKTHGTYLQGTVNFDQSKRMPNGLVFIDTVSGKNITPEGISPATPRSDFADVAIHGNPSSDPQSVFNGWLFVNGSLSIDGDFRARGLVYAQSEISYHPTGSGRIDGALVSRNIRRVSPTTIGGDAAGGVAISYSCAHARTGGQTIPNSWAIIAGTYRELCDSCS
jgi:hypothetical protein